MPRTGAPASLGAYRLVRRTGEGGTAEVFDAVALSGRAAGHDLTVKRLRPELSGFPELVRMFIDKARIAGLLDHPNIVRVLDFGGADGSPFLVMERLDGVDLDHVLRRLQSAHLSLRATAVAEIGLQVARGLHHAHTLCDPVGRQRRIVHRDVTPAHVMLLRTGGVKILNFGVMRAAAIVTTAQAEQARLERKLDYVSPEQARGEPLDPRSDVFSLGILMWEMLTGRRLFGERTRSPCGRNVLEGPIEPPSAYRRAVPAALDHIVLRALARDRSARYQGAGALAQDLENFVRSRPAPRDAVRYIVAVLARRRRRARDGAPRAGTAVTVAERSPVSPSGTEAPAETARSLPPRWFRTGAPALLTAVALAAALLGWRVRARARQPLRMPAPTLVAPAPVDVGTLSAGTPEIVTDTVRVEISSNPAGATVYDGVRKLGWTPLAVHLVRSSDPVQLLFHKAGFKNQTSDLRPRSDAHVFVELARLHRPDGPRPSKHRRWRKHRKRTNRA